MSERSLPTTPGLHHVTAISSDPQRIVDFYAGVLGLRLVKRTVNFDDPGSYHLYFGDGEGRPGSLLTFFPWPGALPGRPGKGETRSVGLAIPEASLGFWVDRLVRLGVPHDRPRERLARETVLALRDPDGMEIELIASADATAPSSGPGAPVPEAHVPRRIVGIRLALGLVEATAALLRADLGLRELAREEGVLRLEAGAGDEAAYVDLVEAEEGGRAELGAGRIHHVAFRARDEAEQAGWRASLAARGRQITPVLDRQYFRSVYYREPGGVLLEIATDPPGFALDEAPEALGEALRLPPWLEPRRAEIEGRLPSLTPPASGLAAS